MKSKLYKWNTYKHHVPPNSRNFIIITPIGRKLSVGDVFFWKILDFFKLWSFKCSILPVYYNQIYQKTCGIDFISIGSPFKEVCMSILADNCWIAGRIGFSLVWQKWIKSRLKL